MCFRHSLPRTLSEARKWAAHTPIPTGSLWPYRIEATRLTEARSLRDTNGPQEITTRLPALQTAARQMRRTVALRSLSAARRTVQPR